MGRYVNGKWNESLPDLTGNGGSQSNTDSVSAPAPSGGPSTSSAPPPSGFNTNDQSVRADLRNQGYFVDASGVYAPGAGNRVQDTFSGPLASNNVAPSPTQLPILNGHPVSPSNGFTGTQTPYVMYRGDPLYSQYFGPDTPGYSSTSRADNATPGALPSDQATYAGTYGQPNTTPQAPKPATPVTNAQTPGAVPGPTPMQTVQTPESSVQSALRNNDQAYLLNFQQPNDNGTGYGPYSTPQPPQMTVHGRYTDNGNIIEKSTDQYGNEYFQTVGQANAAPNTPQPPAPAQSAQNGPQQPQQPTGSVNPTTGQPQPAAQPTNGVMHTVVGPDGKPYSVTMTDQDWTEYQQDKVAQASAEKQAREFDQGISKDKVDIDRAVAQWNQTYQQSLLQQQDRAAAQQAAYQAMLIDLQKQAQELQRQQQAQTVSLERDKLDLARQQLRGNRRHLPQVRYH
jgi:hypothetical protein